MDLALNNLQRLICHIIQPTNQPTLQKIIICYYEHEITKYKKVKKRKFNFQNLQLKKKSTNVSKRMKLSNF